MCLHDRAGLVRHMNSAALRLCGLPVEAVVGKPWTEVMGLCAGTPAEPQAHGQPSGPAELRICDRVGGGHRSMMHMAIGLSAADPDGLVVSYFQDVTQVHLMARDLEERHHQWRALVDTVPDGIVIHVNGVLRFANPAAAAMFGFAAIGEMYGRRIMAFVPPESRAVVAARVAGAVRHRRAMPRLEEVLLRADGSRFHAMVTGRPVDFDGGPAVMVAITDISDLKRVEAALRDSEERYRQIFTAAKVPQVLSDPEDGRILDANAAASAFYGFSRAEMVTLNWDDLDILHPAARRAEARQAAEESRNHVFSRHRLKSGVIRDVEVHAGPLRVGGRALSYSIIHDVTDRRQVEADLRILSAALHHSSAIVVITDAEPRIQYVNPEFTRVMGFGADEVIGCDPAFLRAENLPERARKALWRDLRAGRTWRGAFRNRTRDGREIWLAAAISPVLDDDGTITN